MKTLAIILALLLLPISEGVRHVLPSQAAPSTACADVHAYVKDLEKKVNAAHNKWIDAPELVIIEGWEREIYLLKTHGPECAR